MTLPFTPIAANTNTFGDWLFKTNQMLDAFANNVVTNSGTIDGEVRINGSLESSNLYITTIYGGEIGNTGPVEIASNTVFSANVSFTGNTVTLGSPSRYLISGSNTSHFVLAANTATGRMRFVNSSLMNETNQGDFSVSGSITGNINANNINSGIIDVERLPDLDASKITTGFFDVSRIPNLDASKITTGVFPLARIPTLDDSKIPNLDASKITSGIIANARLSGTYSGMIFQNNTGSASSPTYSFSANTNMGMYRANSTTLAWSVGGTLRLSLNDSGNLTATGDVTAFSDRRLKKNINTIENALEMVEKLNGVDFYWNEEATKIGKTDKKDYGIIAQEVEEILPEIVFETNGYKTVAYEKMIPVLIQCIKELKKEIEEIKR